MALKNLENKIRYNYQEKTNKIAVVVKDFNTLLNLKG